MIRYKLRTDEALIYETADDDLRSVLDAVGSLELDERIKKLNFVAQKFQTALARKTDEAQAKGMREALPLFKSEVKLTLDMIYKAVNKAELGNHHNRHILSYSDFMSRVFNALFENRINLFVNNPLLCDNIDHHITHDDFPEFRDVEVSAKGKEEITYTVTGHRYRISFHFSFAKDSKTAKMGWVL